MRFATAALAIVLLTLLVFAPVRNFDYVSYDDPAYVSEHQVILQGLTAESVRWALNPTNGYSTAGGPLTFLSHMVDVELFGMRPGPQHLVNLFIHALNGVLLLLVLWRLTGALGRSTVVAALFVVHPLHVESVAWITERKDVLSTLFWMLTMLAYVSYVRRPGTARFAAVFVLLTMGLLSKATLVTLPFVLLLLDAWPLRRAPINWLSWDERERWWPLVREKLPLLVPVALTSYWIIDAQAEIGAVSAASAIPWTLRLQSIVTSYAAYLLKMVWPTGLAVFYPFPHVIPIGALVASVVTLAVLSLGAWRSLRTRPYLAVGWLWFLGTLVPMIGFIQVGSHSMADRFTYVPLIGVFIAIAWGLADLVVALRWPKAIPVAVTSVVILAAAVTARAQVEVWRNSESLWDHAFRVTTGNFRAYAGLAEIRARQNDKAMAITYYKAALKLAPDAGEWYANLGLLQSDVGEYADALASFRRALDLRPDDVASHNNLAAMLARVGRPLEGIPHLRRALELQPSYALARRNLGLAFAAAGDFSGGVQEMTAALRLSPNEAQWHFEIGAMYLRLRRLDEGVAHLRKAIQLDPTHQAARDLLAQVK